MPDTRPLLLTCEHGGNEVPADYAHLFSGARALLESHRGLDIGALAIARHLAKRLEVPLVAATTTRLLVDLNRSPSHPRLYSEFTRGLTAAERQQLLARHYQPYRDRVTHWLAQRASAGAPAVHVSVHTFADQLNGRIRRCDVGLLYDPSRTGEADFCRAWQALLTARGRDFVIRRNYPYRGVSDGFVTWLRRQLDRAGYMGIELEVNQTLAQRGGPRWRELLELLAGTLAAVR